MYKQCVYYFFAVTELLACPTIQYLNVCGKYTLGVTFAADCDDITMDATETLSTIANSTYLLLQCQ